MTTYDSKAWTGRESALSITFSRFPWQRRTIMALLSDPKTEAVGIKYGWRGTPGMGRFGGGWNWKLGIQWGGSSVIIDVLVGSIRITRKPI